ncbi:MAG: bifunctional pyr operon transcriptional regulator/uracil phosphoribosyltransferase PyrR [Gammaproteobacteria bacterium]|nr:bifunctional pyr operon transcriptional regulator/uracil phosphoribosyltransferase PyrR [Gammaproteobacteria bacterium]MCF6231384.1 bifunctional pyr operon transcriptional regulator/uracil phosphoribosyltransferase PyrR [Gammaproteobacteria bacterium]
MRENFEVTTLLVQMGEQLQALLKKNGISEAKMIGIYSGGVWVAEPLHRQLGLESPLGCLNISFYRDDFTQVGMHPEVKPSNLPFGIDGENLILVDDVLYTGRTIRAALNEIFDYGRPASVTLVVLADRNGRELPIQADVVGVKLDLDSHEQVKLSGPQKLSLNIIESL